MRILFRICEHEFDAGSPLELAVAMHDRRELLEHQRATARLEMLSRLPGPGLPTGSWKCVALIAPGTPFDSIDERATTWWYIATRHDPVPRGTESLTPY